MILLDLWMKIKIFGRDEIHTATVMLQIETETRNFDYCVAESKYFQPSVHGFCVFTHSRCTLRRTANKQIQILFQNFWADCITIYINTNPNPRHVFWGLGKLNITLLRNKHLALHRGAGNTVTLTNWASHRCEQIQETQETYSILHHMPSYSTGKKVMRRINQ